MNEGFVIGSLDMPLRSLRSKRGVRGYYPLKRAKERHVHVQNYGSDCSGPLFVNGTQADAR